MRLTVTYSGILDRLLSRFDTCPWSSLAGAAHAGSNDSTPSQSRPPRYSLVYTAEERARRDATRWTLVQGLLAPAQFIVFAVSLYLVVAYLLTGEGLAAANFSIVIKTLFLYAIMVTGAIWEKVVFGRYLFARSFFWEDVFSMLVIALHTAYLVALVTAALAPEALMYLALTAYATYVINAGQFLIKMRAARLQAAPSSAPPQNPILGAAE